MLIYIYPYTLVNSLTTCVYDYLAMSLLYLTPPIWCTSVYIYIYIYINGFRGAGIGHDPSQFQKRKINFR
jgi:hypothetical protein